MRRAMYLAWISVGLMTAVSCASSEEDAIAPGPDAAPDDRASALDGGTRDQDATATIRDASTCSEAGWCITALPDRGLVLKDIWPLERRAFAIAESHVLGIKILEWNDRTQLWSYIDDNTQNEYGIGKFAGKIWAPSDNEVYYSIAPGIIYRGRRDDPTSPWSWQRDRLADNSRDTEPTHNHGLAYADPNPDTNFGWRAAAAFPALGVWGTSSDDVYAWYANTIFHRTSEDGAAPTWIPEYVLDDPESPADTTYVFSASGTSANDVWFASGRVRYDDGTDNNRNFACPVLIHKTADGYHRVIDAVINAGACDSKPDTVVLSQGMFLPVDVPELGFEAGVNRFPWPFRGWLTSIASVGPGIAMGILNGDSIAYVDTAFGSGGLAIRNRINVVVPANNVVPWSLNSVWFNDSEAWVSGWGLLLRMDNNPLGWSTGLDISSSPEETLADAGTYSISRTVINGIPVDAPLYQVRGTSNINIWAIGAQYALHKTTP